MKGREALKIHKELRASLVGEVTPEKIAEELAAYQKNLNLYGSLFSDDFPFNVKSTVLEPYSTFTSRLREVMADSESGLVPDYLERSCFRHHACLASISVRCRIWSCLRD